MQTDKSAKTLSKARASLKALHLRYLAEEGGYPEDGVDLDLGDSFHELPGKHEGAGRQEVQRAAGSKRGIDIAVGTDGKV